MDWTTILGRDLEEGKIRELYLYKLPVLKTCDNWSAVKEVGRVDFKGKHADYHGGIVKYAEKVYFIPDARIEALAPYRKWNWKTTLRVVTEEEHKKLQNKKK
ncbi:MAG: hypothetical protein NZM25_05395 [Leptospiraceae bacterium]|nr:hypothetical protein [Leptospiraceae bacterium]MDW8305560.1 hypothetical protein [Leptospiraceae bacterium]